MSSNRGTELTVSFDQRGSSKIEKSKKWYVFLNSLYDKLSQYSLQKRFDFQTVDFYNYRDFMKKVKSLNITEQSGMETFEITHVELKELNEALKEFDSNDSIGAIVLAGSEKAE